MYSISRRGLGGRVIYTRLQITAPLITRVRTPLWHTLVRESLLIHLPIAGDFLHPLWFPTPYKNTPPRYKWKIDWDVNTSNLFRLCLACFCCSSYCQVHQHRTYKYGLPLFLHNEGSYNSSPFCCLTSIYKHTKQVNYNR